jgi:ubiquinone/menaquinone biosynthesis C-methylase UbiE
MKLPDQFEEIFDEASFWGARFGALLLKHLEVRPNVAGLDVGCATGFPLFELAGVHGPGSHFTGIDVWKEALERGRRKRAIAGVTNVELIDADAAAMPFDDASFDLIVSNLGINNFDDPAAALRECFRVARLDARIALTTNLTGTMGAFYQLFRETLRELGREDVIPKLDEQERHRGTRASVEALLTRAGFRVTRAIEDEFEFRFASGTALFHHRLVAFFYDGWRGVIDDDAVYARIEEKLNAAGEVRMRIPMLYAEAERRVSS